MRDRSKQTPPVVRAGISIRISWDPEGQRAGVERQRVDCEVLCACRGWEIGQYFEDNDASAYSGKPRRAYERMLSAIDEGAIGAIVTWHNDRLHRSPKELEAFIDLMERSRVRVAVVTGGDYDLTTPEGRFTARIVGSVARLTAVGATTKRWARHWPSWARRGAGCRPSTTTITSVASLRRGATARSGPG